MRLPALTVDAAYPLSESVPAHSRTLPRFPAQQPAASHLAVDTTLRSRMTPDAE